ncbi:MAG TPA: hypothetical protein ENJ95_15990 [Bacteroidetes bacterium]|nr:hypothetical protein [Bacteroidota bacterium]
MGFNFSQPFKDLADSVSKLFQPAVKPKHKPAIRGWNRLEGNPRKEDFDRSLRAEIRDPLWMLARQWQFGEFEGEDAGSPINVDVLTEHYSLNRYAVKRDAAGGYSDEIPLEAQVERETVPNDLGTQVMLARYLLKDLKSRLGTADLATAKTWLRQEFAIAQNIDNQLHRESVQMHELALATLFDGFQIYDLAKAGQLVAKVNGSGLAGNVNDEIIAAGGRLKDYFESLFTQPDAPESDAWKPSQLEYQFDVSAENKDAETTVLRAEEYAAGHLDWYSFDIDNKNGTRLTDGADANVTASKQGAMRLSFLPAPVSFQGMPKSRFWEMEDYKTEFSDITANTTDLAKMLFSEFALLHADDWVIVPYTLETGTMVEVKGIVVTDVFGEKTLVKAAGQGPDEDWQRWNLFNLHTTKEGDQSDHRLFLPPVVDKILESEPIEKVNFLRDEMANMVWAVESVLPSQLGAGINGHETALRLKEAESGTPAPPLVTEAKIRYVLGTDVPYNWIPFAPVQLPGSNRQIRLQRAKMPGPDRHRSQILAQPAPYFVREEEVPRSGATVTRSYQRTRWHDGKTYVWIGKRKQTGKGEGSSGLQFDQIREVKE